MVDDYWLEIHPNDYILEVNLEGQSGCIISIMTSPAPYFILGDSFLRGYYTVHDMENNRIGFAPHKDSPKRKIVKGIKPRYS
jgi:hypothetical protein